VHDKGNGEVQRTCDNSGPHVGRELGLCALCYRYGGSGGVMGSPLVVLKLPGACTKT
jgi:hypothetical protein